jgi:hypothetical protein
MDTMFTMFTHCPVFKMFQKIEKPAAREMWSVIQFLTARNMKPVDIHRQLCDVYGEHATSDSMVWRWVRHFNEAKMCMMIHEEPIACG